MLELLGKTQQELLRLLQKNKEGLSIFGLADLLSISRTAVKQHLVALEKDGMVEQGSLQTSGGRPTQRYVLTNSGKEQFPRQYSWFAQLLIETIQTEKNNNGLKKYLERIGSNVSLKFTPTISDLPIKERLNKVANILTGLGYEAKVLASRDKKEVSKIEISNCVFHQLAMSCPDVCAFDKSLLAKLTGKEVELQSCMTLGDNMCCFGIKK
jgi:predicted ArsR family transcriptional regulator